MIYSHIDFLFCFFILFFYFNVYYCYCFFFFFSSRRRHTRLQGDWSSDVCSSDLVSPRPGKVISVAMFRLSLGMSYCEAFATIERPLGSATEAARLRGWA